jgi:subtilisin family serine protease
MQLLACALLAHSIAAHTYMLATSAPLTPKIAASVASLPGVLELIENNKFALMELSEPLDPVEMMLKDAGIAYMIEENVPIVTSLITPNTNLDRLDQRQYPLDGQYVPLNGAFNIPVYIVDTGVNLQHSEFEGRASRVYGSGPLCDDHGSWVASIVAGKTYGVAKDAKIYDVKLTSTASCEISLFAAVKALEWLAGQPAPLIATLSWNTVDTTSYCLVEMTRILESKGALLVSAAGNSGKRNGACQVSPANSPFTLTVAASEIDTVKKTDLRASFSNYGQCIWGFAPGTNIKGASAVGSGVVSLSGTSASAPHVAGLAAQLVFQNQSMSPEQLVLELNARAVLNSVGDNRGTPNRLLNLAGKQTHSGAAGLSFAVVYLVLMI